MLCMPFDTRVKLGKELNPLLRPPALATLRVGVKEEVGAFVGISHFARIQDGKGADSGQDKILERSSSRWCAAD